MMAWPLDLVGFVSQVRSRRAKGDVESCQVREVPIGRLKVCGAHLAYRALRRVRSIGKKDSSQLTPRFRLLEFSHDEAERPILLISAS